MILEKGINQWRYEMIALLIETTETYKINKQHFRDRGDRGKWSTIFFLSKKTDFIDYEFKIEEIATNKIYFSSKTKIQGKDQESSREKWKLTIQK